MDCALLLYWRKAGSWTHRCIVASTGIDSGIKRLWSQVFKCAILAQDGGVGGEIVHGRYSV